MKIYNELESLGFFQWLKEKGFGSGFTAMILDAQPFDSIERSGYNAIAFRWFREKHRLDGKPEYFLNNWYCFIVNDMKEEDTSRRLFTEFPSYEEAELECLKKLIEITQNTNK